MLKHTKIVATVSDQRCDVAFVEALYKAGMNVVRLNTAHMMEEGLTRVVNNLNSLSVSFLVSSSVSWVLHIQLLVSQMLTNGNWLLKVG